MGKVKIFIALVIVVGIGWTILDQVKKEEVPGKTKRLECLAKVTSFERAYDIDEIKNAQKEIRNTNYSISSDTDKAVHMNSTLFDHVDMQEMEKFAYNHFEKYKNKTKIVENEKIKAEFTVFENDKEDPKKKSDQCKLYRGYVVWKFKNKNNKVVYQNQIDFWDSKGADVKETIKCGIEAFMTY